MSRKLGIVSQKILALIQEKDVTLKGVSSFAGKGKRTIRSRISTLRLKYGYTQIQTKHEKGKYWYHWLTKSDSIQNYIEVINSRTKKALNQVKFSNKTNIRTLELKGKNPKVMSAIQISQKDKGQQALLQEDIEENREWK